MAKLDITAHAVDEFKILHLKNAEEDLLYTDEPDPADPSKTVQTPVTIPVYGPGSRVHAQAAARRQTRQLEQLRKKGKLTINADETLTQDAEWLADITGDFSANFSYPPAGDKTGRDLRLAVFSDRKLGFLGDQIEEERKDWANFSKGSATN